MVFKDYFGNEFKYSTGSYDKCNEKEQWIRITEGCPHDCEFCYEPKKYVVHPIPEIRRNDVKITDMNLLCKKESIDIIKQLGQMKVDNKVVRYELICGIDYRFLTQDISDELKKSRFKPVRLAWDGSFHDQRKIREAIRYLEKSGYSRHNDLFCFMVCNHKISYTECCMKLEVLKANRVRVADCWYDNQASPNIIPIHWTEWQIKDFRRRCRRHNIIVKFGYDPEFEKAYKGKLWNYLDEKNKVWDDHHEKR